MINPLDAMPSKHTMPSFLEGVVTLDVYEQWLRRKAIAHVDRDRKRGRSAATRPLYKEAIHAAVIVSKRKDAYTGETSPLAPD